MQLVLEKCGTVITEIVLGVESVISGAYTHFTAARRVAIFASFTISKWRKWPRFEDTPKIALMLFNENDRLLRVCHNHWSLHRPQRTASEWPVIYAIAVPILIVYLCFFADSPSRLK